MFHTILIKVLTLYVRMVSKKRMTINVVVLVMVKLMTVSGTDGKEYIHIYQKKNRNNQTTLNRKYFRK